MRLFVDNLTNVDFSYLCRDRGLVGETWMASIELTGPLDEQGMVCDFGKVKKHVRDWLDDTLDHKLLVPVAASACEIAVAASACESAVAGDTLEVNFAGEVYLECPSEAIAKLEVDSVTADSVAAWCMRELAGVFGEGVEVNLKFAAESIEGPYYHYSHGLKKHEGNCQRIAHGHRSKIEIWKNHELDRATMASWAERWADIYLATHADRIDSPAGLCRFEYRARQGRFFLQLPASRCYFLDTDTTVEHIAQHIADTLARAQPGEHFRVKAYEGIGKGAIAEAQGEIGT